MRQHPYAGADRDLVFGIAVIRYLDLGCRLDAPEQRVSVPEPGLRKHIGRVDFVTFFAVPVKEIIGDGLVISPADRVLTDADFADQIHGIDKFFLALLVDHLDFAVFKDGIDGDDIVGFGCILDFSALVFFVDEHFVGTWQVIKKHRVRIVDAVDTFGVFKDFGAGIGDFF
ncbi:hypothetical protein SAMN02745150_01407 [Brevinema andersonii]|uniref:Uncharacterized protein n=1 Tax=Brevinema andersonii TaxID=34097 RepID=A0A1I1F6Q5_BREAD|nr:hypothetical protein SAMN02745150_01407 [Brevinema andersonii]